MTVAEITALIGLAFVTSISRPRKPDSSGVGVEFRLSPCDTVALGINLGFSACCRRGAGMGKSCNRSEKVFSELSLNA
jgi:hypothetical protein